MSGVAVIGASGRSGAVLCRALMARGTEVVPVVRDAAKWGRTGLTGAARVADLADGAALRMALAGVRAVVSCAHARHAGAIIEAAPEEARFVFLGSTRKFTQWPDAHGLGVLAGEAALLTSGRRGVMLHPTMIYGAQGENNVQRLVLLLRRLPMVPLPGGGRALVQPIHQDDVTACILAALERDWATPETLVIAGGAALPYAGFVQAVTAWAGLRPRPVVPVPAWALMLGAPVSSLVPGLPRIGWDEVRRLLEDKAFDTEPMRVRLGVHPVGLTEGLRRMRSPG